MTDKTIELNRRRVLGGLITVGGAAAAAGAGTFAYFNDSQTSADNDIVAGTLTLSGTTDGDFAVTDVAPGQRVPASGTTSVETTYDSDSTIDPVEVDLDVALSEPTEPAEPTNSTEQTAADFASQVDVQTADLVRGTTVVADLTSTEGVSTVQDLGGLSLDDAFGSVSTGDTLALDLAVTMNPNAGNDYQADGVSIDVTFTAQQPGGD